MQFFCDCGSDSDSQSQSESEVSSTLARLHFASKCDFFQFQDGRIKSHNRSEFIRLIHSERFSCDCVSKSLREIRTSSNFSLRIRNRRHMRSPHLHYAIFLRLRIRIAIAIKSHIINLIYTGRFSCECERD